MKQFFKAKKKLFIVMMLMLIALTGCSSPRGENGKTYVDSIITLEDVEVEKQHVDFKKDSEEAKKYANYEDTDLIKIEKTKWMDVKDEGWFHWLIVYPIAQLINLVAKFSDAGIGIIVATFLIQVLMFLLSLKQQVSSQRMQELQPELLKIQAKYEGRTDDHAKMQQAQEMQALYNKYKVNPIGSLVVTFLQFPIILGMYQATMRAHAVVNGTFLGINLAKSPLEGIKTPDFVWYIVIFLLMIGFQFLSFKIPQWLGERRKKAKGIKEKKYAQPKNANNGQANMNMVMYSNIIMISLFAINWPLAMSFYWLVGSVIRVLQNIVINKFFIKD